MFASVVLPIVAFALPLVLPSFLSKVTGMSGHVMMIAPVETLYVIVAII